MDRTELVRIATGAAATLRESAAEVDASRCFPHTGLKRLGNAGLLGLTLPAEVGGLGGGLGDLAAVVRVLGEACASTAMCSLMHCVAAATVAARATPDQLRRWGPAWASGERLATLAFSESGTGAHFYQPQIALQADGTAFRVDGAKSFVTSGGEADDYVLLTRASRPELGLDVCVVTRDAAGVSFAGEWRGIGMAGNHSVGMELRGVRVGPQDLVGGEGAGEGLVFQVVAPYFLLGLAAVNAGIAHAAAGAAAEHARTRTYADTGQGLGAYQGIQWYLADMRAAADAAEALVYRAAEAAEAGEETALLLVMESKVKACEAAIAAANTAMEVGGGRAYARQLPIERHLRDARAGAIMAPTNEVLREWIGKTLVGLPLF